MNGSCQIDGLAEAMTEEYQYCFGSKEDRIHKIAFESSSSFQSFNRLPRLVFNSCYQYNLTRVVQNSCVIHPNVHISLNISKADVNMNPW